MTVESIEASEQDCAPREIIEITHGTTTYRIATGTRDIVYGGQIYTAVAAARGEIGPVGAGTADKETTLILPVDHALVKRYLAQGTPPKLITVTMRRIYVPSGDSEQIWTGEITSMAVDDDCTEAIFRVVARAGKALLRIIPNVTAGRTCPHVLYGSMCRVSRTGSSPSGAPYQSTTTVMYVNGREVRIDLSAVSANDPNRASWAKGGELTHLASGETMTIQEQTDLSPGFSTVTDLRLEAIIYGMKVGDSVIVQAGCARDISACHTKFGNRHNFGGFNKLPTKQNIHVPHNVGISSVGEF
jgi:hypothetical protein